MSLAVAVQATFEAVGSAPFDVDVELSIETGETLVVLGPSGSGKTLLLETVAGYHDHAGSVVVDGRDVSDAPPEDRDLGFVFQDHALFPHLTVRENVAFGRRYHPDSRDPDALLDELGLGHLADRTPATLSGGEAQRVALARSLAIRPSTILLDEPLSSLDVPTMEALRADLARILDDVTALYVTHDRTTALHLGDRIAVMRDGRLVQVGTPAAVFQRPATPFVARFTGGNCVPAAAWAGAVVDGDGAAEPAVGAAAERGNGSSAMGPATTTAEGAALAIRPEHVVIGGAGAPATVERRIQADVGYRVTLARNGSTVEAYARSALEPGSATTVGFPVEHVTRFEGSPDGPSAAGP